MYACYANIIPFLLDVDTAQDDDGKGGLTGVSRAVLRKKKKLEALEAARSKATEQVSDIDDSSTSFIFLG